MSNNCLICGKIHDCKFYEDLMKSLDEQLRRYELMIQWYQSTLEKIDKEIDKGFPSELSDK